MSARAFSSLLLAALIGCSAANSDVPAAAAGSTQSSSVPCDPDNAGLTVPSGFCAVLVTDGAANIRHIVVAPNGDVIGARRNRRGSTGSVVVLRDTTGDGKADVVSTFGPTGGTGIALRGEHLYFAPDDAVLRYAFPAGSLTPPSAPDSLVRSLPTGGHTAKTIAVARDGSLYVNIGSRTNSCQQTDRTTGSPGADPCTELETRAGIWRFDANATGQTPADGEHFATGIRNMVALTWDDETNALWGLQHGRDQLYQNWGELYDSVASAELPSEELMRLERGADFGWPYCYHDWMLERRVLAPEYGGDAVRAGRCGDKDLPVVAYPGHWAPNALVFYRAEQFPQQYQGGIFIAFHGSWNRAPLPQQGYKVVFQPMRNGAPAGKWLDFADGFRAMDARPTGLAVGPDGSLYVSDDGSGRIWRISYTR
jgi:glucose/arabinose dehydrogenase